ncbi:MAG: chromosome segregation protein SMC [Clostridiales bacterium]|jgi:chromosome segregation protein|nr:chromosome segregation protein SMC [Clostridiales bacterium]
MYLKSIEVHGFKSFANKMLLEFDNGITAIVGPNGSGKSNIADAVRWVLGEQSAKQLRGAKMEDVIFSGTEMRKPLGYAYVSLTMDNSDHKLPIDFEEVTVTRKVYRSGESEYMINGSSCRLKDIQELFMDTGIGKEGYSIIGQGQIDKILSGKPEDRRELFDEAAGIVKFKRRKYSAEKNLEEERLNLSRVSDIISEIERQLAPLESQSEIAKIYLKYKEELKDLEVYQFLKEYDKIHKSKEDIDNKLTITNEDMEATQKEYENTKDEYKRLEQQLEEFDASIEANKASYNDLLLSKEKAEGEIKVLNEQIKSLLQNDEYYQDRIHSSEQEILLKKNEEQDYLSEKEEIDLKITQVDDKLSEALVELDKIKENISNYTKEIERCSNSIFEYMNMNSGIKGNIQRYETMLEQNAVRKAQLNQRIIKIKSEEAVFEEEINKCKENLNVISDDILTYSNESTEVEKFIENSQSDIEKISHKLNELQGHYHLEKSKLESLINLTERYEGYGNSIKRVMEQKNTHPGVVGVVADIIKTEKEYETAIETALGQTIQNIVTNDEKTAKDLIAFLKKNKYGRATFLPLTNISAGRSLHNHEALKEKGVIGLASTLVVAENNYNALIDYLLGRIIVVDDIDNASIIAKKYNYSLRLVTKEGEYLTPGGSISGGAYKNVSNLLGRRREIEALEEEIKKLHKQGKGLTLNLESENKKKSNYLSRLDEAKKKLQEKYLMQNTAKINLEQAIAKKTEAETVYQDYIKELDEIEHQALELMQNLEELSNSLSVNQVKNSEMEKKIEELNLLLSKERETESLAGDKASSLKMELSSHEQSNYFIMENVRRVKREIERIYEDEASIKGDMQKAYDIVQEKKLSISQTKETINKTNVSLTELDKNIKEQIKERDYNTKIHKNFFEKRDELSGRIHDLDKESIRLTSQKEKLVEQIDQQMNHMWEEYELTYSTAVEYYGAKDIAITSAKKSILEIRTKIKELGDVNVNAIEDFKNLSERYDFLTIQREDLIKAEEALLEIISELDSEMKIQFKKQFEAINKQFDLVFKELFGGGKADLELTDDEDVLEAGIRINAQPPGKKLQNIMQLSGGEKALTAISLLFAILNLKPSPFCLLDEIEAALDDSNVKRFAKYLRKLSKETQFIIITHRRNTMASADILYGITMQEKGISTLVSVSLIENELTV